MENEFENEFSSDFESDFENPSDNNIVTNDANENIPKPGNENTSNDNSINIPNAGSENVSDNDDENTPNGDNKNVIDNGKKTGLILAGGGAKGAYQVGVLKALKEAGLLDDVGYVSGDSIGAINAMLFCHNDIDFMYKVWENINMPEVFEPEMDLFSENPNLFSRNQVTDMMNKFISEDVVRNLPYTVFAGVSRVENGEYYPEYMKLNGHTKKEMIDILLASSAMPVVYESVNINGKEYLDGGLTDNEPLKPLYDMGIRRFIIIGLNHARQFPAHKYPGAECFVIYPSHDLGDLFSGTMNYKTEAKHFRQQLGYKDGQLAIKTVFEKDPIYISLINEINRTNYLEIKNNMKVETAQRELGASIDKHMEYFNQIADKYKDY